MLGSVVLFNAPPVVAWWNDRPLPFEMQEALRLDPSIIAICVALCLATSLVFGFLPAARFSRPVIISSLKDDAGVGRLQAGRVHRWAAALQVAIAVPLIVLCGIAVERVRATATADLGFDVRPVVRRAVEVRRSAGRQRRVPDPQRPRESRKGERGGIRHGRG